jgi:outer membrane protein OmpA-like peptidoglycan-associated protein
MYSLVRKEKELNNLIVKGVVKDLFTGKLVPGTVISILRDKQIPVASQIVGIDGAYKLEVPAYDTYTVKAAHKDYNVQERELVVDENYDGAPFDVMLEPVNDDVDFKGENYARGTVKSNETGEPLLGTLVSLYDEKGVLLDSKVVDEQGRYTFDIAPNKNYVLTAHNDKFDVYEKSFAVNDTDNKVFSYDVFMLPSSGKDDEVDAFRIKNVLFDYDKSNIRPDASIILDELAAYMKQNPKVSFEIAGHADAYGYNEYNIRLSQRRANSTAKYLIKLGISRNRINTSYFGEKLPLNGCIKEDICTVEEYAINRRCEFTLIK